MQCSVSGPWRLQGKLTLTDIKRSLGLVTAGGAKVGSRGAAAVGHAQGRQRLATDCFCLRYTACRLAGGLCVAVAAWMSPLTATAADLKVVAPNAVKESIIDIAARFERETGHRVVFSWGGSAAIARRVAEGEVFDVIVKTATTIERLAGEGRLVAGTPTDFARSGVAVAVRAGLALPDVSTPDALRPALLQASSIAISSGTRPRLPAGDRTAARQWLPVHRPSSSRSAELHCVGHRRAPPCPTGRCCTGLQSRAPIARWRRCDPQVRNGRDLCSACML